MVILALLPAILLLIYIFRKDKREKESFGMLFGCLFLGVLSIIPSIACELIGSEILAAFFYEDTVIYIVLFDFLVVGMAEEGFKYFALKLKTWKTPQFNCFFDGIVYAVFVSIGFAAVENIAYVSTGGLSTALLRMFTAVPSHACNAVFMGYFYSKSRQADLLENREERKKNSRKALFVPVILHGIYDCLISFDVVIAGGEVLFKSFILWILYVIAYFAAAFFVVRKCSAEDSYFIKE